MMPLKSSGNIEAQWLFATVVLKNRGEMRQPPCYALRPVGLGRSSSSRKGRIECQDAPFLNEQWQEVYC
jgi:hypothetical protein